MQNKVNKLISLRFVEPTDSIASEAIGILKGITIRTIT